MAPFFGGVPEFGLFQRGSTGQWPGNTIRIGWEYELFGDAYDEATAFERCKYGALNAARWGGGLREALGGG